MNRALPRIYSLCHFGRIKTCGIRLFEFHVSYLSLESSIRFLSLTGPRWATVTEFRCDCCRNLTSLSNKAALSCCPFIIASGIINKDSNGSVRVYGSSQTQQRENSANITSTCQLLRESVRRIIRKRWADRKSTWQKLAQSAEICGIREKLQWNRWTICRD